MTWQMIETAPKDGRLLIVGWDSASVWIVRAAWWRSPEDVEQMRACGSDASADDVGWWSYIHSVTQEKLEGSSEPTHWLAMPPAPNGDA